MEVGMEHVIQKDQTQLGRLGQLNLEKLLVCPICTIPAGRLRRGKVYCENCGFIES